MAIPLLIPLLILATGAGAGAFVGAQIDDKIETPAQDFVALAPSPTKVIFYAAAGMGLLWLAHKSGTIKLIKGGVP